MAHGKDSGLKFKFQKAPVILLTLQKQSNLKRNGHDDESITITANTNTLKSVLEISNDFHVDFRMQNSFSSVLGF